MSKSAETAPASEPSELLSILTAILLLFIVTAPVVSSKLEALWSSEFTFAIDVPAPACVSAGFCFRFLDNRVERTASGYRIEFRIEGVDNVYEVAKELDEGTVRVVVEPGSSKRPAIVPRYNAYNNPDEAARQIGAFLHIDDQPAERIELAFARGSAVSEYRTLVIRRGDVGTIGHLLLGAGNATQIRTIAGLLVLLMLALANVADFRSSGHWAFGVGGFAVLVGARGAAISAAANIASPTVCLALMLAALLPWLAIASRVRRVVRAPFSATMDRAAGAMANLTARLWPSTRSDDRLSIAEIAALALGIAVFGYMLWFGPSFRWSIFEERDFLEARHTLSSLTLPLYGPELLAGGHTIGGSLYLILAPVVALWNEPEALLVFNRLLFLGMPLILWWAIRYRVGAAGTLFAVFALIASERVVALSYWPIHPNFSLLGAFLYAGAVLRGAVDGHRGWLVCSGLLLGLLTQLHFSYFLLLPCHALLVAFGNGQGDRWTKPLALAAVFVPLAPYLVLDALAGFPNIAQIVQQPRFHPAYVPAKPFGNAAILPMVFSWSREVGGPFSSLLSTLTVLLIGLGIVIGVGSVAASARSERRRITPALAVAILFCVPVAELTALGMGYNSRHTIAAVPALFMLAGIGFGRAVGLLRPAKAWIGTAAIVPLLVVLGIRAADSANMGRIIQSEGEWAVDYKSREAIATDLAVRLGVSPEVYAKRTFWWWVGWSIDPAIYAGIYRRVAAGAAPASPLPSDHYVLITSAGELPPFLKAAFDDKGSHPVGGMYVHVAVPKPKTATVLPSSNADTGVRLHAFLQDVDLVRHRQEGFARIGQQHMGSTRRDLFLGFMAEGRIKLIVATEQSQVGDRGRLRWCVDSPSLNGHYQEIKTIWQPRLVLTPEFSPPVHASLAGDVLGSLLFKTPRCGEAWSERAGSWQVRFALDGVFDQSFMLRPDLSQRQWPLEFSAALQSRSLSQTAVAEWLNSRFDR